MLHQNARMRFLLLLMWISVGFVSGGASCSQHNRVLTLPPPPTVLSSAPTVEAVIAAVNRTGAVRELSTNTASVDVISMPALPQLSATVSLRRDRDFRLRARLPFVMGSDLDIGSNNDLFWFEVPEDFSRTLYYARHDQFQAQLNRAVLPVDPTWLMDSLGLAQIDRAQVDQPIQMSGDGKLVLQAAVAMPAGVFRRFYTIDPERGHVIDQYVYSPTGQLIAESHASNHQFYADQGCSLPHTVRFRLIPAAGDPLEMQIEVGTYVVNQILSGDPNLFVIPQGAGKVVDLTTISPLAVSPSLPTTTLPPMTNVVPPPMPSASPSISPVGFKREGYQDDVTTPLQFRGFE
ncbi:hypothetical protein [Roseiconus lacunae]|uniref:DUF4292 domain-containing protein n=1 Tax=Roseiconus lacunae TaxID=2605694 RepID=A0ABT7PJS3_9BACT|nr:hypothetical protein [Roseiconus lacunae]MDM4016730.1 hypothetical protein [Roseiconus lacunae]